MDGVGGGGRAADRDRPGVILQRLRAVVGVVMVGCGANGSLCCWVAPACCAASRARCAASRRRSLARCARCRFLIALRSASALFGFAVAGASTVTADPPSVAIFVVAPMRFGAGGTIAGSGTTGAAAVATDGPRLSSGRALDLAAGPTAQAARSRAHKPRIARFFTPFVYGYYSLSRPSGAPASIYVSRGIGTIGLPVRIGAPPEITLLRPVRA